jgi:ABC-type multidrug transport system permease subunit
MARMIAYREQSSKAYKELPFAIAIVIAEMPYSILCAVCFFLPIYYIPGLSSESFRAGYQFFMILITELFSVTLGQMIAALTPDPFISSLVNPFVIVIFALFCGVTIPKPAMPGFWRAWLYELDPFTRLIGGMIVTELHDRPVECTSMEYNRFTAPDGQDCGSYMSDFFSGGAPGYILNNATNMCEYCAYKVGDQFYEPLGYEYGNRWRDLGIFIAFIGSNLVILLLAVSLLIFRVNGYKLTFPIGSLPQLQSPLGMVSVASFLQKFYFFTAGYRFRVSTSPSRLIHNGLDFLSTFAFTIT